MNRKDKTLSLMDLAFYWEREIISKLNRRTMPDGDKR